MSMINNDKTSTKPSTPTEEYPLVGAADFGKYNQKLETKKVIITDEFNKKRFEMELRPLTNAQYALIADELTMLEKQRSSVSLDNSIDEQEVTNISIYKEVIYPMITKLFPECCINPRIVKGGGPQENVWDLEVVPTQVASVILDNLFKISGLGSEGSEEIKK